MDNIYASTTLDQKKSDISIKKNRAYFILLLYFVAFSMYLGKTSFVSFHTMMETICAFIGSMMFAIVLSTFKMRNESSYINFLGISYGFVSIFNMINGLKLYNTYLTYKRSLDVYISLYIISKWIYVLLLFTSLILIQKDNQNKLFKTKNLNLIAKIYLAISVILMMDIFVWETMTKFFIKHNLVDLFKTLDEYIMLSILSLSLITLHKKAYAFNKKTFRYLKLSMLITILGELLIILGRLFIVPYTQNNLLAVGAFNACKLISIVLICKTLIDENIIHPYKLLNCEINERKKAQLDLGKKTNILDSILESTNNGIIVLNLKKEVIHFNKAFIDMFDIKGSIPSVIKEEKMFEFINKKLLYPEDVIERIEDIYNLKIEINDIIQLKNGKTIEVVLTSFVLDGEKNGCIFNFRDITQSKMFERELEKSTELYRKLLELLPDAVYVQKGEHIIITNKKGLELSQKENIYELALAPHDKLFEVPRRYSNIIDKRMDKLLTEETSVEFLEQQLILDKNIAIDVEVAATSFIHESDHYIVTVMRDISERKKAEKLEEQVEIKERLLKEIQEYDDLKTQFFTTISHELKTPLNVILGGIQLIESTKEDIIFSNNIKIMDKYLRMMKQNCYRLLRLISNLIDITRADAGFLTINTKNCNVVNIVEEVTLSVAEFIKIKGINLVFDTEIEEKVIACDEEKLERILLNLLSNAIKFTKADGEINVNIYDRKEYIVISVKDTGIGIPDDMQDKIFERFRQVDTSLRREAEGSGIGLSIVKSIVELHGGNIKVKSTLGKGSEFIIELPVKMIDSDFKCKTDDMSDKNVEMLNVEFSDIYL
ncbi:ATP-binding protein [Gottschalkia purinilytica]|nr:ATP-binding protein [Gottschalkia purinilytica]